MANFSEYKTRLVNGGDVYVTISAGQNTSDIINVYGASVLAFIFDAAFTSSSVSFLASIDGINFFQLVDAYTNNPIAITSQASKYARILPTDFVGVQAFKLVTSVNQTNNTKIQIVCGPLL